MSSSFVKGWVGPQDIEPHHFEKDGRVPRWWAHILTAPNMIIAANYSTCILRDYFINTSVVQVFITRVAEGHECDIPVSHECLWNNPFIPRPPWLHDKSNTTIFFQKNFFFEKYYYPGWGTRARKLIQQFIHQLISTLSYGTYYMGGV